MRRFALKASVARVLQKGARAARVSRTAVKLDEVEKFTEEKVFNGNP